VLTARAALGRFDGATTLIAFATSAGKVVLHNTQDASAAASAGPRQAHLNINKQVSVLATGPLLPNSVRDVLLVGTPTCLHCYDVEHNRDLFFRDVPEGVACICVGSFGVQHRGATLALVGGAGALQAFDSAGREVFWSAVSGGVTALALADVDEDGCNELLVGCDDGCIWVYRDKDVVQQIHEADAVVALTGLGQGRKWAYALANGTIGVYEGGVRLWRVKSKHGVTSLAALDLGAAAASAGGGGGGGGSSGKEGSSSSSTQPQLISGWSSGRVEARSISSGEVVGRDSLGGSIAALLLGQLRQAEGAELELLAVSSDGELRGYVPHNEELVADVGGDVSLQQRLLVELAQKKHQLVYELGSYHGYQAATGSSGSAAADGGLSASSIGSALAGGLASSLGAAGLGPGNSGGGSSAAAAGGVGADRGHIASIIPPDTRVHSALTINRATQMCELVLKTSNDAVIRAALIFGEQVRVAHGGWAQRWRWQTLNTPAPAPESLVVLPPPPPQVFEGESLLVAPQQPGPTLMVPLATRRDAPVLLLMKVLVGSRMSAVYHLFELDLEMPKFALYAAEEQPPPGGVPEGHVCFELQHPVSSVASWLETRFGCRVQLAAAPQGSGSGSGSRGRSDGGGRQQQQLTAHFTCLRTKQPLAVRAAPRQLGGLMVWLHFDSMALAGSLLQVRGGS
jgi:Bardet-Biedl syndrome 2 protein